MDLRQLRYFVGIVQAGSLSRAADRLHVAQSAISHHLANLESELGRQLVTRGPKGIALTDAGGVLYRHAEAILRHVESAKHDTMSAANLPSGRVSVGFPFDWANVLGYPLFAQMRSDYPQIHMHIIDGKSAMLREQLINGRLDMAVLFSDQPERGLTVEPLLYEELFYVTADDDSSPITLADAAQRPLLVPGPGSGSQRVARQIFSEHGLAVNAIGEIDTLIGLRSAVASGLGNAILPWSALYDGDREISLTYRQFADAKLARPAALCFSEMAQRGPAVDAVAQTLKSLVYDKIESETWHGVSLIAPEPELSISPAPP